MIPFLNVLEFAESETVFKAGDEALYFYFILSGKLEITVKQDSESKMSKTNYQGEVFGFSQSIYEIRNDLAQVVSSKAIILSFPRKILDQIQRVISYKESNKKIEFLLKYFCS